MRLRSFQKLSSVVVSVAMLGAVAAVGLAASPASATTSTTVVVGSGAVYPGNPSGIWALEATSNTGTYSFVTGPATPPGGTGSLAMTIGSGNHEWLNNYSYGVCQGGIATCGTSPAPLSSWTPLSTITALSFSAYRVGTGTYPSYNIETDYAGTGASYTTFVFIPTAGLVVNNTWQTWDAMNPADGTWYSTTNTGAGTLFNCNFQAAGCNASWAQITAAYPTARIKYGVGPNLGTGGTFAGNIDNFTIGISNANTVYDFEPNCTTVCYVNGTTGHDGATGTATDPAKTVQEGVNLVTPGGTVNVAAGTYTEQVLANKAVTITGAGAASTTIQGPATMTDNLCIAAASRAVLTVCGSTGSTVTVSGVTISGGAAGEEAGSGCNDQIFGAFVLDSETLNISASTVTNVYNSAGSGLWGCQQGIGIRAGSDLLGLKGNLIANNIKVLDYQKGGIVVDGSGSSGTITNSVIQGDQLPGLSTNIAMNGVEIARGASGSISGSTVSGNECNHPSCGPNPLTQTQSAGILLFNSLGESPVPAVSATNNVVTGNDIGIYTDELTGTSTISGNTVNLNREEGLFLDEGSTSVTNNSITNNGTAPYGVGVIAAQGELNSQADVTATLTGNTISGNPTGIEAVDTCPGVGCPGPPAPPGSLNTTDAFTVHLTANRNSIAGNSTIGASNATPSAPQSSTFNATCNWWGAASGPGPVGPGSGDKVSTGVVFSTWLVTSNLAGACSGGTATAPSPPTIGTASSGGFGALLVSFTPGANGGSPITSFTATCVSLTIYGQISATGTGSPITVQGLQGGTPYSCYVTATNAIGTSGPSGSTNVFYPAANNGGGGGGGGSGGCTETPSAPRSPSAASEAFPGAAVSWAAPATGCVAGYIVTPYLNGVAQTPTLIPGVNTTTVIRGLVNGGKYTFTVAAENGSKAGPASVMTSAVTIGAPAATPAVKAARIGKGSLKVSFAAPRTNGAAIKSYTATCVSSNHGATKTKTANASPITVTGLSAGKVYRCTVAATNSRGTGPSSQASAAVKA